MPIFDYDNLIYQQKRFAVNLFKFIICVFLLIYFLASCDVDYYITKYTAPRFTGSQPAIGATKTPVIAKKNIIRKHLSLKPISKIEMTGFVLFAQKDYLRTNCPYKKELVENINALFPYIYVIKINEVQVEYLLTADKRIVRQVLKDIGKSNTSSLLRQPLRITIYGYEIEIPKIKKIWNDVTTVSVEKIIVNNRIYE